MEFERCFRSRAHSLSLSLSLALLFPSSPVKHAGLDGVHAALVEGDLSHPLLHYDCGLAAESFLATPPFLYRRHDFIDGGFINITTRVSSGTI